MTTTILAGFSNNRVGAKEYMPRLGTGIFKSLLFYSLLTAVGGGPAAAQAVSPDNGNLKPDLLSSGARAWLLGPEGSATLPPLAPSVRFGTNVDAADPAEDLAAGQSETAIAANGDLVMSAWNDATGFVVTPSTLLKASLTGVGFSADGGATFKDLEGLPNDNPAQKWSGDPSVKAIDESHFIVSSLYLPTSNAFCSAPAIRQFEIAVSVATVDASGGVTFTRPIIAATGGNFCFPRPPTLALLDKPWMTYDPDSRTLVISYTRFFFFLPFSGNGQIEIVRATVPDDPASLSSANFSAPIVVWPEEPNVVNQGSYIVAAPGGDAYIAWERNWQSNRFNGDPFVYIRAALVPFGAFGPSVGGPINPRVVTLGQVNSNGIGGVKSLDTVPIPGYSRGTGNDFPRIAYRPVTDADDPQIIIVWNDGSLHPLGDIWMRALTLNLDFATSIQKVNDDDSFALHFLPAVSVRDDGSIATSWYDRRLSGADSTVTDYFGEVRPSAAENAVDFRITTGSTNWLGVGSFISPNFGDYTDNFSTGLTTFFNWADGRIGVPQPFVDNSDNALSAAPPALRPRRSPSARRK